MTFDVQKQLPAAVQICALEHRLHTGKQARDHLLQHRCVKAIFIFEIVIEQRFVDPGGAGNFICAGAGYTFVGKLLQRGIQDGGTGLLRLSARARFPSLGVKRNHLIIQLVRLSAFQRQICKCALARR